MLAASGCVPGYIKQAVPYLSVQGASYVGERLLWAPRYYRLFSVLPGYKPARCRSKPSGDWQTGDRSLAVLDCTNATPDQIDRAGRTLDKALNSVEELLGQRIHVSEATYVLVRPEEGFLYRSSQILRRRKLEFRIAIRFDASDPHEYEIDAVRSTAHELYHMASLSGASRGPKIEEEKAASIFETCVERKVFDAVRAAAFDEKLQPVVGIGHSLRSIDQSVEGNRQATIALGRIAGPDLALSSDDEHAALDVLCKSLAVNPI
jgi:hypothetical protein